MLLSSIHSSVVRSSDSSSCISLLMRDDHAAQLPTPPPLGMLLSPSSPTMAETGASSLARSTPSPPISFNSTACPFLLKAPPSRTIASALPPFTPSSSSSDDEEKERQDDPLLGMAEDGAEPEHCFVSPRRNNRSQHASNLVNNNRLSSFLNLKGNLFGGSNGGGSSVRLNAEGPPPGGTNNDTILSTWPKNAHRSSMLKQQPIPSDTTRPSDMPTVTAADEQLPSSYGRSMETTANSDCATTPSTLTNAQHHHQLPSSAPLSFPHTSSTATAFYSGVKLAPPIVSAHVTGLEKRSNDQHVWYTIQVQPRDLLVPTTASETPAAAATATTIPRKPYSVYRRYEDVAEFADQLEDEFPILGSLLMPGSDQGIPEYCKSLQLPRLANRLVLFVTKAVCQQRKEDLDRYLQELFALGPVQGQSRLVSEFFGIWKTDMEIHLSHKDGDPLALQHQHQHQQLQQQHQQHQRQASSDVVSCSSANPLTVAIPSSFFSPLPSSLSSPTTMATPTSSSLATGIPTSGPPLPSSHTHPSVSPPILPRPLRLPLSMADWSSHTTTPNGLPTPHPDDLSPTMETPPSSAGHDGALERERTFKKLKSFQSSEPALGSGSNHEEVALPPLCTPTEEKPEPTLSSSTMQSAAASTTPMPPTMPINDTSASLPLKPKVMKRAKAMVSPPEVTMLPLASKHDIPPWNRIPATGLTSVATTPLSLVNSHAGSGGGSSTASPMPGVHRCNQFESTDAPQKLSLTSSKTIAAISTAGMEPGRCYTLTAAFGSRTSSLPNNNNITNSSARSLTATATQSAVITSPQLIAPWNRQSSNREASTHLHSLIKISNAASSSSQMTENKNGTGTSGSMSQGTKLRSILKNSTLQPYAAPAFASVPMTRAKTPPAKCYDPNDSQRKGMTHSTSAPSGMMPALLNAKTRSQSPPSSVNSTRSKQKRESLTGPGGKPIVGILKNASSHHSPQYQQYLCPSSARRPSQETIHDLGGAGPNGTAIATTFKIVVDADTIVALQVLEEPDFVLSLKDLRQRIIIKLQKSNIVLRDDFELAWVPMSNNAHGHVIHHRQQQSLMGSAMAMSKKVAPLETDEHLFQAMLATPSRKVTLRCNR